MTLERVDFYLLNQNLPDGKLRTACRLARKALEQGYTAFVQVADPEQAGRLDDLMWTFDQGSFVPHCREGDGPAPVVIGCQAPENGHPDVLITLADGPRPGLEGFRRILEVVDASDGERQRARERYRVYKGSGCKLETHQIS